MSEQFLPRHPAWSSFKPAAPAFMEVSQETSKEIQKAMGAEGRVLKTGPHGALLEGYYMFEPYDQSPRLLLKVIPKEYEEHQSGSEKIARYLKKNGIDTNAALPDFPKQLGDRWVLFAYVYIPSRFTEAEPDDLRQIGLIIAKLHNTLFDVPFIDEIINATKAREKMLLELQDRYSAKDCGFAPDKERFRKIIKETPVTFDSISDSRQVIHGDLNYGNIIFSRETGKPTVLDFEDSLHSWLPPIVDIALAMERFSIVNINDKKKASQLGITMIKAYQTHAARRISISAGALAGSLRILSARSLCLLAGSAASGSIPPGTEWDKFFYLHEQSYNVDPILNRVESEFNNEC